MDDTTPTIDDLTDNVERLREMLRIAIDERDHEDQITGLRHELRDARTALETARAAACRFWVMQLDGDDDGRWAGWWGVVDENEGGIVAVFGTEDRAYRVADALRGDPATLYGAADHPAATS